MQASSAANTVHSNATVQSIASANTSGCFSGMHITFWTRSHTATLKQKLAQAGAVLEDRISEHTQLVVAARDTSATDAAANLADLPASLPLLSKKWEGRRLKIPTTVDFVVPQFISDCLVQGRVLPTSPYLIALQQVATKDTRTYSNEECTLDTSAAPEVSQLHKPDQPMQQQLQLGNLQAEQTDQGIAGSTTAADASAIPGQKQHEALSRASTQKADLAEQAVATTEDAAEPSPKRKLGIYPDVSPEGRVFTGGPTGIPWGTGCFCTLLTDLQAWPKGTHAHVSSLLHLTTSDACSCCRDVSQLAYSNEHWSLKKTLSLITVGFTCCLLMLQMDSGRSHGIRKVLCKPFRSLKGIGIS